MIIKFIAENDAEKARLGGKDKLEHFGVKEYFVVGNKTDSEGSVYDFHDWHGAFKFLLGELNYYYEIVNDERRAAGSSDGEESPVRGMAKRQRMIKRGDVGKIQPIDLSGILGDDKMTINMGDEAALDNEDENMPKFQIMTGNTEKEEIQNVETTVEEVNKEESIGKRGLRIVPPSRE
jgi:hypothetical protein